MGSLSRARTTLEDSTRDAQQACAKQQERTWLGDFRRTALGLDVGRYASDFELIVGIAVLRAKDEILPGKIKIAQVQARCPVCVSSIDCGVRRRVLSEPVRRQGCVRQGREINIATAANVGRYVGIAASAEYTKRYAQRNEVAIGKLKNYQIISSTILDCMLVTGTVAIASLRRRISASWCVDAQTASGRVRTQVRRDKISCPVVVTCRKGANSEDLTA